MGCTLMVVDIRVHSRCILHETGPFSHKDGCVFDRNSVIHEIVATNDMDFTGLYKEFSAEWIFISGSLINILSVHQRYRELQG